MGEAETLAATSGSALAPARKTSRGPLLVAAALGGTVVVAGIAFTVGRAGAPGASTSLSDDIAPTPPAADSADTARSSRAIEVSPIVPAQTPTTGPAAPTAPTAQDDAGAARPSPPKTAKVGAPKPGSDKLKRRPAAPKPKPRPAAAVAPRPTPTVDPLGDRK